MPPRRPNFVDKEVVPIFATLLVGFCLFVAILLFGAGSMFGGLLFSSILIPVAYFRTEEIPSRAPPAKPDGPRDGPGEMGYPIHQMSQMGGRMMPGAGLAGTHSWLGHLMAGCLAGALLSFLAGMMVVGLIFTVLLGVLAYVFARHPARRRRG